MSEQTRRTRGVQRGPRSVQVVENVRAATLAEMARAGFANFTIDGVAKAANVNRTTIYRRWPSKTALLAAVIEPLLKRYDEDPDTGSLSGDLLTLLIMIRDNSALPEGRALTEAVRTRPGELRELVDAATDRALAPFRRVLRRAARRGEIGETADTDVAAYLAFCGVVMWEQLHGSLPTDEDCARILGMLLSGLTG
jgi:AcrR family transcriptional regulator